MFVSIGTYVFGSGILYAVPLVLSKIQCLHGLCLPNNIDHRGLRIGIEMFPFFKSGFVFGVAILRYLG